MKKPCPSPYIEFISKPEINFWIPIIFTVVSITMSFMVLTNKVELLTQKMETIIANQDKLLGKYENVQVRLGTAERDISMLQSNQAIVLKNLGIR
jgi:hypothetical protein